MAQSIRPLAERFWAKVQKTETCWVWTARTNNKGYGMLFAGQVAGRKRQRTAHRVSWELHYGPIPAGMEVCHHCDNPPCVRPGHLFLGTHADNMADCSAKGRMGPRNVAGERNPAAKLTAQDVRAIRDRLAGGGRQRKIAADYGVSSSTVHLISKGKKWGHLP